MAKHNAAPKPAAPENTTVSGAGETQYITIDKEAGLFDILVSNELVKGKWDAKREKVIFDVPAHLAERFALHHHVQIGRLIKK